MKPVINLVNSVRQNFLLTSKESLTINTDRQQVILAQVKPHETYIFCFDHRDLLSFLRLTFSPVHFNVSFRDSIDGCLVLPIKSHIESHDGKATFCSKLSPRSYS